MEATSAARSSRSPSTAVTFASAATAAAAAGLLSPLSVSLPSPLLPSSLKHSRSARTTNGVPFSPRRLRRCGSLSVRASGGPGCQPSLEQCPLHLLHRQGRRPPRVWRERPAPWAPALKPLRTSVAPLPTPPPSLFSSRARASILETGLKLDLVKRWWRRKNRENYSFTLRNNQ